MSAAMAGSQGLKAVWRASKWESVMNTERGPGGGMARDCMESVTGGGASPDVEEVLVSALEAVDTGRRGKREWVRSVVGEGERTRKRERAVGEEVEVEEEEEEEEERG